MNSEKPIILCLVGKSGSGKTTIANHLEEFHGWNQIQSFTTRKPRVMNEKGHTFVSELEYELVKKEDTLAYTKFGDNHYWTTHKDIQEEVINIYVIDEKGLLEMQEKFSDRYTIISCWIERSEENRKASGVTQERIDRDEGMFTKDPYSYTCVINSDMEVDNLYFEVDTRMLMLDLIKAEQVYDVTDGMRL